MYFYGRPHSIIARSKSIADRQTSIWPVLDVVFHENTSNIKIIRELELRNGEVVKIVLTQRTGQRCQQHFRNRKLGLNQTILSIYFKSIVEMMMVYAGSRFCVPLTIIIPLLTSTDLRDAFSPSKLERTWADSSYQAAVFPLLSKMNQPVSSLASSG